MAATQAEIDALLAEAQSLSEASAPGAEPVATASPTAAAQTPAAEPADGSLAANLPANSPIHRILQINVPLMVVLAQRKMPVREILNICIGSIIEFDKPFDEELELLVNNRSIAFGHAVKIGENFGLRVARIGDVRERIDALRPSQPS